MRVMAQLDDLQVDMAGCLVGVFAVLWLTKTGLPPEDPGRQMVDLEVRVAAAEKFVWAIAPSSSLPAEISKVGKRRTGHYSSLLDNEKRKLLEKLLGEWEGLDVTASVTGKPTLPPRPLSSAGAPKWSIDDHVDLLPVPGVRNARGRGALGSASDELVYYWETDSSFIAAFRATFDPAELHGDTISIQVSNPEGHDSSVDTEDGKVYLYRLLPRWEVLVGGHRISPAPDYSRATMEDLRGMRLRRQAVLPSRCDQQNYEIVIDETGTRFTLAIQDKIYQGPNECLVLTP